MNMTFLGESNSLVQTQGSTYGHFRNFILEMNLLLDFIGGPDSKFTFENDESKGFSCLKEPLPFCLNPAKGNSRKEDVYDIYGTKITLPVINNLRRNVQKNLNLAGLKSFSSKEAICKNETKSSFI